jgi:c-di-GMP-binding flagellar brake protein YcgR
MRQSVSVLLLDDGELDDVQEMLESLRIPFGRIRGASIVPGMQPPSDLLIATPRRIDAVLAARDNDPEGNAPVRIVVTSEDSNGLREQLRRVGFDYIVRRPVHTDALRLLILHAMFTGEEQRSEPRVAIGFAVTFKSGLVPQRATLADLSSRGCGLLTRRSLDPGKRLKIEISETLCASEAFVLRGRVLHSNLDASLGSEGVHRVAVLFEKVSAAARQKLEWIIEDRSTGPSRLNEGEELEETNGFELAERGIREIQAPNLRSDPRFEPDELRVPEPTKDTDPALHEEEKPLESVAVEANPGELANRRQMRRAAFAAKVPAFGDRALRVLVGRDLSVGGMRVEATPELAIGDRLHLAIYGEPDEEPFLVWAEVVRDDGEKGLAIDFDELHPVIAEKLEKLVVSLPAVESLHDDEAEAMGTVISEMLAKSAR